MFWVDAELGSEIYLDGKGSVLMCSDNKSGVALLICDSLRFHCATSAVLYFLLFPIILFFFFNKQLVLLVLLIETTHFHICVFVNSVRTAH